MRVSKFFRSGFSPPFRVSYFSSPALYGLGSRTICFACNLSFSMYLSLVSMLDRLVLKNAADYISQRLKQTSEARVMIFCYNCVFSLYLSLGSMPVNFGKDVPMK